MATKHLIRVFEHETIRYGNSYSGVEFKKAHFDALVKYNETQDNRFFIPVHRGIKFQQYVGVVQVGKVTIEILPKADNQPGNDLNRKQWQGYLLEMLKVCKFIELEGSSEADLNIRHNTLMDLYIHLFLNEVERLIHAGLIKQYRTKESNRLALTGKIQFQEHINRNLVHKERFFVRHQVYDRIHLLHQVIYEALSLIPNISTSPKLSDKLGRLLLAFPEMPRLKIRKSHFNQITCTRKSEHYNKAIDLAKLLLLHYSPDLKGGNHHVLAILFDMNQLFEEYIFRQLKKVEGIEVSRQNSKLFWESKRIRPDIILKKDNQTYVIDTKWKILSKSKPSDEDLKQMYAYHHYWDAAKTMLIYPNVYQVSSTWGTYRKKGEDFQCGLCFVDITKDDKLNSEIATDILISI